MGTDRFVAVGHDGSPASDTALAWAATMASRRDEQVVGVDSELVVDDTPGPALVRASASASLVVVAHTVRAASLRRSSDQ